MTITHHPSEATLAAFAAGHLDEARAVIVASHVALCPHCRATLRAFEHAGGVMLDEAVETDTKQDVRNHTMQPDALNRALARIDAAPAEPVIARPAPADGLPAPLALYAPGSWRSIGSGVQLRSIAVPSQDNVKVFMLRAGPGTRLPHHKHTGTEWTCILEGAYRHDLGRYGAGDFDEADETIEHKPVVENDGPCVCLVALEGGIRLQSLLGRLIQPFVRF